MSTRHTRRNPQGPVLGTDALAKVEHMRRGAKAEKRWQQAMHDTGVTKITVDNLHRVEAAMKRIKAEEGTKRTKRTRGGRHTRKSRSTRRH